MKIVKILKLFNPLNVAQGFWYMLKAIFTGDKDALSIASINLVNIGFIPKQKLKLNLERDIKKDIIRAKRKGKTQQEVIDYYWKYPYFLKLCKLVGISESNLKSMVRHTI